MTDSAEGFNQGAAGATVYRRADLQDLVTVTLLKLPPQDARSQSMAALLGDIEAEIRFWAISKPILAARRLRKDRTRGVRLGDLADMHSHLANGADRTFPHDLSREARILARAAHSIGSECNLWANVVLPTD
ncbi:hypothetical protein [Mycolicibacterium rutilum]|uniref:hypothetical protein n=1 Tax=Mycolicibacterium rutilum TaxID=370526 RepID=UPI0009F35674|nr:hypothetical protein [Mycolicibacterium rutilum]